MSVDLHVLDIGNGPVVVLLHAFPCDGRMWEPQAAGLVAAGWRVIVPDLPGFGRSALLREAPSLEAVASRIVEHLAVNGVDRCVLGGVSLGGYVTMAIMRAAPQLVGGVMLCDTKATADSAQARENRERLAVLCAEAPDECGRILDQAVLPGLLGDTTRAQRPEVVARVRGWLNDAEADTVAWYQRAMAPRPDSVSVLEASAAPALVVWGEEDVLSPRAEQDLMISALPDVVLETVPGAGHLANVERPEVVTEAMRRFLDAVRDRQTS